MCESQTKRKKKVRQRRRQLQKQGTLSHREGGQEKTERKREGGEILKKERMREREREKGKAEPGKSGDKGTHRKGGTPGMKGR